MLTTAIPRLRQSVSTARASAAAARGDAHGGGDGGDGARPRAVV